MEIFTAVLGFLTEEKNILALGWVAALVEGYVLSKIIRQENEAIKELRDLLDQKQEARILDLKEVSERYELMSEAITKALQKLSRPAGGKKND